MSRSKHQKNNMNPPAEYKKLRRQKRRAQEKEAVKKEKFENIPEYRKSDRYDYW